MADGFQTIGWLLTARDMASKPMQKATDFMQRQANKTSAAVAKLSDTLDSAFKAEGPTGKGLILISKSFVNVFGSAATGAMQKTVDAAKAMTEGVNSALDAIGAKVDAVFYKERTFGELFTEGSKAAVVFGSAVKRSFKSAITLGRTLAVSVGDVFSKLGGVGDVISGIKKVGGIGGALLGPLGPLLDLFSPLLNMITRQFTPAIETFSAIVETAFGPFAATLEVVARNIALQIVPIIAPLGKFLELAAVQVGMLITDLLKGKPEVIFAVIFKAFKDIGPILVRVLNVLLEVGAEVGGTLLKAFLKLAPLMLKSFGSLLEALIPLIPPLTKLAVTLLEKVFIPGLEKFVKILDKHIIPFLSKHAPTIGVFIEDITESVADFFGNFDKYMSDMKINFIDPVTKWATGLFDDSKKWATRFKADIIDPIMKTIQPIIDKVTKLAAQLGILTGKSDKAAEAASAAARMTRARGIAELNQGDLAKRAGLTGLSGPARDRALSDYLKAQQALNGEGTIRSTKVPQFAGGAIVRKATPAIFGEAGPEMALPLNEATVRKTLGPLLPDLTIPGMDRLVAFGDELMRLLKSGRVRVDAGQAQQAPQQREMARTDRGDNLGMSLGMTGAGGF